MTDTRAEIEALLPAYVSGQLEPEERARVERALAEDPDLAEELRFVEALADGVRRTAEETAPPPGELGWYRLRRSVAEESGAAGGRSVLPWRPALAAAAVLVIAVQAGLLWQAHRPGDAAWESLSSDAAGVVQVRWAEDAAAGEIERLLRRHRLEIVSGPSASGVYRLRPAGDRDEAALRELVRRLRERGGVVAFAALQ